MISTVSASPSLIVDANCRLRMSLRNANLQAKRNIDQAAKDEVRLQLPSLLSIMDGGGWEGGQ